MEAFRIADRRRPILDGTGSFLYGGRWNSPGRRVIYAAETFAGALLEILVHANLGRIPREHVWTRIKIPKSISIEEIKANQIPDWNSEHMTSSRAFGDQWFDEGRTAILAVPSVVSGGMENNLLINRDHPEFHLITSSPPEPVIWDKRLLRGITG